ncbi:hypothetical protein BG006_002957 [Podila minutissima]|uniref:Uncharacterized protein n=1 Tax=Podila minutissima TaxID=64525 RepID=A0A9P5VNG1_9FUNG|nr:hypothetical protein BG006_002957 [Podila minutissima]
MVCMCQLKKTYHLNQFTNTDIETYLTFRKNGVESALESHLKRRQHGENPWDENEPGFEYRERGGEPWDKERFIKAMEKYVQSGMDLGNVTVNINVQHDDLYLDGNFTIEVTSSGIFAGGQVMLDFNATSFLNPSYGTDIPKRFKPLVLSTQNYTNAFIIDYDPMWFINCNMHCDMSYIDMVGRPIPGSKFVQKTCYFCPTVGKFYTKRLKGDFHKERRDGIMMPNQDGNPFEALAGTKEEGVEEVGDES